MEKKLLTISVAAYNVGLYLEECLKPFATSKFDDLLEILIIDDGATDGTPQIAQRFEKAFPQIFRYVHKQNGGWGSVLNCGIKLANGKYFKQLDGDDFFNREALERLLDCIRKTDVDIIYTDYNLFCESTGKIVKTIKADSRLDVDTPNMILKVLDQNIQLPQEMHTLTMRTKLLQEHYEQVRILERCFYTDVEYWIKAVSLAETFLYLPCNLYQYRIGRDGQSVSLSGVKKHYSEHRKVLERCIDYVDSIDTPTTKRNFLVERLKDMAGNQYIFYLYLPISKSVKRELIEFDRWLRLNHLKYYPIGWERVKALKYTNFILYPIIAKYSVRKLKNSTF